MLPLTKSRHWGGRYRTAGQQQSAGPQDASDFDEREGGSWQMLDDMEKDDDVDRRIGQRQRLIEVAFMERVVAMGAQTGFIQAATESDPGRLRHVPNEATHLALVAADIRDDDLLVAIGNLLKQGVSCPPIAERANREALVDRPLVDDRFLPRRL